MALQTHEGTVPGKTSHSAAEDEGEAPSLHGGGNADWCSAAENGMLSLEASSESSEQNDHAAQQFHS